MKRFFAIFLLLIISFNLKANTALGADLGENCNITGDCSDPLVLVCSQGICRVKPCSSGCNRDMDCQIGSGSSLICQENYCRSVSAGCPPKAKNCASYCFQTSLYGPTTLDGVGCTCYSGLTSCDTFCIVADSTNTGAIGRICTCDPTQGSTATGTINKVSDFIFKISMIIAPLLMVLGAFLLTTAGGSVEQVDKAKKLMITTIIGFVIILLAKAITDMIRSFLGG